MVRVSLIGRSCRQLKIISLRHPRDWVCTRMLSTARNRRKNYKKSNRKGSVISYTRNYVEGVGQLDFKDPRTFSFSTCIPRLP